MGRGVWSGKRKRNWLSCLASVAALGGARLRVGAMTGCARGARGDRSSRERAGEVAGRRGVGVLRRGGQRSGGRGAVCAARQWWGRRSAGAGGGSVGAGASGELCHVGRLHGASWKRSAHPRGDRWARTVGLHLIAAPRGPCQPAGAASPCRGLVGLGGRGTHSRFGAGMRESGRDPGKTGARDCRGAFGGGLARVAEWHGQGQGHEHQPAHDRAEMGCRGSRRSPPAAPMRVCGVGPLRHRRPNRAPGSRHLRARGALFDNASAWAGRPGIGARRWYPGAKGGPINLMNVGDKTRTVLSPAPDSEMRPDAEAWLDCPGRLDLADPASVFHGL